MAEQTVPFQTGPSKQVANTERRAWVRLPRNHDVCCQSPISVSKDEAETAWLGRVRDISPCGIGLIMSRPFEPETVLIIELSAKPQGGACPLTARVVHATPETKGRWIIGCAFTQPLSQEEMRRFMEE
jgi:hypothetical protein